MIRGASVFWQVFLAVLAVALGAVALLGVITRYALAAAFDAYLQQLPSGANMMGRPRMGLRILGSAEQTFIATVDRSVMIGAVVAVLLSVGAAYLLARALTRPIRRLESAALAIAEGDFDSRVEVSGPEEILALGDAFNHMADSLHEAEELRKRLVADVAHELRNPIAAARAQAEGMAEGVLAADAPRLGSLVEDLEHLSLLVDDLQELSIAEAGGLSYEMVSLDLADLIGREVNRAAPAAAPAVSLTATGADSPAPVLGDEHRLSEVLRNLLANAVRHTPNGSIRVDLAKDANAYRVSVIDTGEGIPSEDLAYVFERFYRADAARATHTGGAGTGARYLAQNRARPWRRHVRRAHARGRRDSGIHAAVSGLSRRYEVCLHRTTGGPSLLRFPVAALRRDDLSGLLEGVHGLVHDLAVKSGHLGDLACVERLSRRLHRLEYLRRSVHRVPPDRSCTDSEGTLSPGISTVLNARLCRETGAWRRSRYRSGVVRRCSLSLGA